jgi:hypothetical protein
MGVGGTPAPASLLAGGGAVGGAAGPQCPLVQAPLQHSAAVVQAAASGAQAVLHVWLAGSQVPRQQSVSLPQVAPDARQVVGARSQRFVRSLQLFEQQPRPVPEVQDSPVGRQSRFTRSMRQRPSLQMFEQHSPSLLHSSFSRVQVWVTHLPPKHPSEQQSCALVQAAPSPKQKAPHSRLGTPVTGSQRLLQQAPALAQVAPAWPHGPGGGGTAPAAGGTDMLPPAAASPVVALAPGLSPRRPGAGAVGPAASPVPASKSSAPGVEPERPFPFWLQAAASTRRLAIPDTMRAVSIMRCPGASSGPGLRGLEGQRSSRCLGRPWLASRGPAATA